MNDAGATGGAPPADQVIAVEQASGRAMVFRQADDWAKPQAVTWSWQPSDSPEIATSDRGAFSNISDAKWADGGRLVIVAASGGGVAIIQVKDKKVTFYAKPGGNTHSVELLPDGNLVSISSDGAFIRIFSTDPGVSQFPNAVVSHDYEMASGHGLVWDDAGQKLWASGGSEVAAFGYNGNRQDPQLKPIATYPTPTGYAHDLFPVPHARLLYLTTVSHVYTFDVTTHAFTTIANDMSDIKSVGEHPDTGQLVMLKPTTSWWSNTVLFFRPNETRTFPGGQFYKARWFGPVPPWR
jgi:hypothetical protein